MCSFGSSEKSVHLGDLESQHMIEAGFYWKGSFWWKDIFGRGNHMNKNMIEYDQNIRNTMNDLKV